MTQTVLQRIAAGDADAVRECLDRYGGLVWTLARRSVANHAEAEDAAQEIFIDLWRSAARFSPALSSEVTFVAMIARRRLIDLARRRSQRPPTLSLDACVSLTTPPAPAPLEISEEVERVNRALLQLWPESLQVLTLALKQGLTQEEISEQTGSPLGTVKTYARRGLAKLRAALTGEQTSVIFQEVHS